MTRVGKSLLTAFLVLAAGGSLGAYAYFSQYRGERERKQQKADEARLFKFAPIDVTSGVLVTRGATIAFTHAADGERWVLTSPVEWPADREAIEAALSHLAGTRVESVVTEDARPADLEEYGLSRPAMSIEVVLKDGRRAALQVGLQNQMAHERSYVTDGARKRIVAVHDAFRWALDRDPIAFRERRVFPIAPEEIKEMRVLRGGAPAYAFIEKEAERWALIWGTEPEQPADRRAAIKLTQLLARSLKAESFASDRYDPGNAAERARYGFDPPLFTVEVLDRSGVKRVVDIGNPGMVKDGAGGSERAGPFAFVRGTHAVAEVYAALPDDLDAKLELLRPSRPGP